MRPPRRAIKDRQGWVLDFPSLDGGGKARGALGLYDQGVVHSSFSFIRREDLFERLSR